MIRATYAEKMKKIVRAVLEISSLLGIGHARAFLALFSSLVLQIDLILHILNVLNSLHDLDMVLVMFCIIDYA